MKRRGTVALCLVMVLVLALCGCVKVLRLDEAEKITSNGGFDTGQGMDDLWNQAKSNLTEKAVDLPQFLTEAKGDLKSLVGQYGKYSMGDSGTISYVVKGSGEVTGVENQKKAGYITVKLDGYSGQETIKLQIGSVYKGSAIRDSLDIISFGDYTNQEEWAAVSQQLHKRVAEQVIAPLDIANLKGKHITFTGAFTVDKPDELLITPVELSVQN